VVRLTVESGRVIPSLSGECLSTIDQNQNLIRDTLDEIPRIVVERVRDLVTDEFDKPFLFHCCGPQVVAQLVQSFVVTSQTLR